MRRPNQTSCWVLLCLCLSLVGCHHNPFDGYNKGMRAFNAAVCPWTLNPVIATYHLLVPKTISHMLLNQQRFVRESLMSPRMLIQGHSIQSLWHRWWLGLLLGGAGSVPITEAFYPPMPKVADHSWVIEQPLLGPTTIYGGIMAYVGQYTLRFVLPSSVLLPWSALTRLSGLSARPTAPRTHPLPKELS